MENDSYLDEEFRQCVSDIKPHAKSLPYKSGALILKDAHHDTFPSNRAHLSASTHAYVYVLLQRRGIE